MSTESIDRADVGQAYGPPSPPITGRPRFPLLRRVAKFVLRGNHPYNIKRYCRGALKARRSGAKSFGRSPWVNGKICFKIRGTLTVGDYFRGGGKSAMVFIKVRKGATLTIGHHVGMNVGVWIESWNEIRIGNNVMIAPRVSIIDDNMHEAEYGSKPCERPVIIGNNVWLGQNVAVLPGVTIGDGSVIGANSVVAKDIPPNVFAAGIPARPVRTLNIPEGWVRYPAMKWPIG